MKKMKWKERLNEYKICFLYYLFRVFPINKKKAVFCNYVGKGFGCNPKYIALELIKRDTRWDIVWIVKDLSLNFPQGIRKVSWDSVQSIYELATAAVWVDNQRKLWYHRKRKSQIFIETWHGGAGPIKKIGADNPANEDNKPYEHTSKHMDRIVDVMVSNGKMRSDIYRRAFLYHGEILECGAPRNDMLVKDWERYVPLVHSYYHIPKEAKIVIYAPTYRKGRKTDKIQLEGTEVLEMLETKFGGDWYMLKRLHPTMIQKSEELKYSSKIINASNYDDMQELLACADVLISDYSSVISEFAIMKKPVFLYAVDIGEYSKERDFYVDYFSLPYSVAKNQEDLLSNIEKFDEVTYKERLEEYDKVIGTKEEGTAATDVVNRIYEIMKERKLI